MKFLRDTGKILLLLVLVIATNAQDLGWYQPFLSERIAPMYVSAYRTLKNNIVNPLLTFKEDELAKNDTNVTTIVLLAQRLTCATKQLYNDSSKALHASEELNSVVEKKVAELMSAISAKENEAREVNNQLAVIESRLAHAQANINQADIEVRNKVNELGNADRQLAAEQDKLERARYCGRRKKRLLGKPWRRFRDKVIKPVIRPICAVLNYEGIKRARERRGSAKGAVNAARELLANRQRELERQRVEQVNFRNQKAQVTAQLQSLSLSLSQLRSRQLILANMTEQVRKVVQHLRSFVSKSSVLYNELQDLVSFENLVKPLNSIVTELIENGVTTKEITGATQISSVEVQLTSDILDLIKARVPSLPSNEGDSYTC
ncbi:unnamed protein product [Rotaria socialis]|uniref:Uncharacterized protein n=2 Tax=Rotaria socialis TaxID=392032 RepID=A0A817WKJ9_9BILA|nr:unnamed protein product [Rotaria socialis]